EGWSKAFSAGAAGTPVVRMLTIIAWLSGLMTAFLLACFTSWGWILYLGFALQLALLARKIGKFPCWVPLVYPIALLFFFVVFARSSGRSGKVVTWKGREIHGD